MRAIGQTVKTYTPEMLRKFDRLTMKLSSLRNFARIKARLELSKFQKEHGEAVCHEMFAVLRRRDAKKAAKRSVIEGKAKP